MKTYSCKMFLLIFTLVLCTACNRKDAKETNVEIMEMETQTETLQEEKNIDIGFQGDELEDSDTDIESEKNITMLDNTQGIDEKNDGSKIEDKSVDKGNSTGISVPEELEDSIYDNLVEPPKVSSDVDL